MKYGQTRYTYECDGPTGYQRANYVDSHVWTWVKSFLMDPSALREGIQAMRADRETELAPLQKRLEIIDEIQIDNSDQLQRLLDLYISGDIERDFLIGKKKRLEGTIEAMQEERTAVMAQIDAQSIGANHVQAIGELTAELRDEMHAADHDFKARRKLIELLDVRVSLLKVGDECEARAECVLGASMLPTSTSDLRDRSRQTEQSGQGRDRQMPDSALSVILPPTRRRKGYPQNVIIVSGRFVVRPGAPKPAGHLFAAMTLATPS